MHLRGNLQELPLPGQSRLESANGFNLHEMEKDERLLHNRKIPNADRREVRERGRSLNRDMGQQELLYVDLNSCDLGLLRSLLGLELGRPKALAYEQELTPFAITELDLVLV